MVYLACKRARLPNFKCSLVFLKRRKTTNNAPNNPLPTGPFICPNIFGGEHLVSSHLMAWPQFIRLNVASQGWQRYFQVLCRLPSRQRFMLQVPKHLLMREVIILKRLICQERKEFDPLCRWHALHFREDILCGQCVAHFEATLKFRGQYIELFWWSVNSPRKQDFNVINKYISFE